MSRATDLLRAWADDPKTANDTIRRHLRAIANLMEAFEGGRIHPGTKDRQCDCKLCVAYRAAEREILKGESE